MALAMPSVTLLALELFPHNRGMTASLLFECLEAPLAPDWKLANVRIVAFVQEQASRRILGAGSSPLRQDQP